MFLKKQTSYPPSSSNYSEFELTEGLVSLFLLEQIRLSSVLQEAQSTFLVD